MAFMTDVDQDHVVKILQCENSGKIPKEVEELYGRYQKAWSRLLQVGNLPVPNGIYHEGGGYDLG